MCVGLLVFSTSKKIAWRVVGRSRSGSGGGTRVANTGSGTTTGSGGSGSGSVTGGAGGASSSDGAGDGTGATSAGTAAFGARRRRARVRLVVVRSMPASYGTRRVYSRRRHPRRVTSDAEESFVPAAPRAARGGGTARISVLLRDGNRRRGLQTPCDVGQGPVHLPEHVHDAAEGLGDGRALAPQCIELALERPVDPAKLTELAAQPLALLLSRLERTPQALALLDQRRNHMTELILAFGEPARRPLRVIDRLDLTHLAWCLLVESGGLRVRR